MNATSTNLFSVIDTLETAARKPALRAICNSSMARAIGAIRQDMRVRARAERDGDDGLDVRNQHFEDNRHVSEIAEGMGFEQEMPAIQRAEAFINVYCHAVDTLATLSVSKWDAPMSLEKMLDFMSSKAQVLDEAVVAQLSEVTGMSPADVYLLHEMQDAQERAQLKAAMPEIVEVFHGLTGRGTEDSFLALPVIAQHQLAVKVAGSLKKARDQSILRLIKTRSLDALADLPLLRQGVDEVSSWVGAFETRNSAAIDAALDAGRSLVTIEEATA